MLGDALTPIWIDVFIGVIRDNSIAQVAAISVLLLVLLDWVFGIGNALASHSFSSEKMRAGIAHKCSEFGFMLVGIIVDGAAIGGLDLGYSAPVFTAVCIYLCMMEIGSLLETFSGMNPDLAGSPVFRMLEHNKRDEGDE